MLGGGLKRDFQEECFLSLSGSDDLCCVFLLLKSPLGLALGPGNRLGGLGFTLLPWPRVNSPLFLTLPKEKGRSDCVGEQALSGESSPNLPLTGQSPVSSLSLSCKMTRRLDGRFSGYFLTSQGFTEVPWIADVRDEGGVCR